MADLIGLIPMGDMSKVEVMLSMAVALLIAPLGALILLVCHWRNRHQDVVLLPPEQYTDLPLTNHLPTEREPDHDSQGLPADR